VNRIFLMLMIVANIVTVAAFILGWLIGDPKSLDSAVQSLVSWHLTTAMAAIVFAMLLHAITLTYFMGTGRWLEETTRAYKLDAALHGENQSLKYRVVPWMVVGILLLIVTGAMGAAADPASPVGFQGVWGMSAATIHFLIAAITIGLNFMVNLTEYDVISKNGNLIKRVVEEVRRIRVEKGLPV
jgi:hypothetical protein